MALKKPPTLNGLLQVAVPEDKPTAIVLAGHNGSGKSTLWYTRLADGLQIPLVNADRLTLSLLPVADEEKKLKPWAARLRDEDERWQKLSQDGVQLFMGLIMDQEMSFAFETVFSYLKKQKDGTIRSKTDTILTLQKHGYFVVLMFLGLPTLNFRYCVWLLGKLRAAMTCRKRSYGADSRERRRQSGWPRLLPT